MPCPVPPFDMVPPAVIDAAKRLFDVAGWAPVKGAGPDVVQSPPTPNP